MLLTMIEKRPLANLKDKAEKNPNGRAAYIL
jgi:hypothetical protein